MVKRGIIAAALIMLAALPAQAESPLGTIKAVKSVPINGVRIVETEQGVFFASDNGRFVWKGPLYDMWSAQKVETLADIDKVAGRVDLKKIGVDFSQLATFTLGEGSKEEVVFVTPTCPHCQKLLDQAAKLTKDYRFVVILLPLGPKDIDVAKRLVCLADKGKALQALISRNYEALPAGNCPLTPLQKNLVTARVLGITSVPYVVRHDGLIKVGALPDLAAWLAAAKPEQKGGS